eukprot:gb/GECG01011448.1/.p1 GENE.gb/GECG01011448.1/~~gb/GECG01011448.1/.p1  ORF type:complete len:883 (+),score=100.93 gb/GECG01011448.1/:1-2649(+)
MEPQGSGSSSSSKGSLTINASTTYATPIRTPQGQGGGRGHASSEDDDVGDALGRLSVREPSQTTGEGNEEDVFEFDPEKEDHRAGQTKGRFIASKDDDQERAGTTRKRMECSPWVGNRSESGERQPQSRSSEEEVTDSVVEPGVPFMAGGLTPQHKAISQQQGPPSSAAKREPKRPNTSSTPISKSDSSSFWSGETELQFTDGGSSGSPFWTLSDSHSLTPSSYPESAPIKLALIASPQSSQHITADDSFPHQESVERWLSLVGACPNWNDSSLSGFTDTYKPHLGSLRRKDYSNTCWIGVPSTKSLHSKDGSLASFPHIPSVQIADVLRVHDYSYVQHIATMCSRLASRLNSDIPRSTLNGNPPAEAHSNSITYNIPVEQAFPVSENKSLKHPLNDWTRSLPVDLQPFYGLPGNTWVGQLDNDSPISVDSWNAAIGGASAAIHAVDNVARGLTNRAFVISRPPGHHAGPKGSVAPAGYHCRPFNCSSGFCLFNNVAIAASHARAVYGRSGTNEGVRPLSRIAIVDFDIHHGNGTEAIIRNLKPHEESMPLPASWGTHRYYSYKPWLNEADANEVLFSSIHMHDGDLMYPGSGSQNGEGEAAESVASQDCPGGDLFGAPHNAGLPPGFNKWARDKHRRAYSGSSAGTPAEGGILNIPLQPHGPFANLEREKLKSTERKRFQMEARREFRKAVREKLIPALNAFQPDIIFISAGFDGHTRDFYYHLTSADYAWITKKIVQVANKWSHGRVISVLEGGYNTAIPPQFDDGGESWDFGELWNLQHILQKPEDEGRDSGEELGPGGSGQADPATKQKRKHKPKPRQNAMKKSGKSGNSKHQEPVPPSTACGASVDHPDLLPGSMFGLGDSAFARSVSAHVESLLNN